MRAQVKDDPSIEAGSKARGGDGPTPPPSTRSGRRSPPDPRADDPQRALRGRGGRVCPRCRHHVEGDGQLGGARPGPVERCPADGLALVPAAALADADGDPFLGTTIADRFVVLGKLGAGSMGTVYRARQETVGRDVAVKILRADRAFDAGAKARFTREARAMSLLSSPHTVTVFDFGEIPDPPGDDFLSDGASLYLAMEMLEGESLGDRLKARGRLRVPEAARIAREALLSLEEAHDKGIIHRDLKPDNLFLARGASADHGEVCKVLDFGIAKILSDHTVVDQLETQAGTVFGTPRYMSPEQAQGRSIDARSDLYSLGVLLYQMLVGRAPFVDDDAVVVMARHIKSTAVPPIEAAPDAGIGEALSAVVMRALAKDPADRPQSARELIAGIDQAMADRARQHRSQSEPEIAPAARSGDVAAVVADDLDLPRRGAGAGAPRRSRVAWILGGAGAVVVLGAVVGPGLARRGEGPDVARAEIAHFAAARRLALMKAEADETARQRADDAAGVPGAPGATAAAAAAPPPSPAVTAARKPAAPKRSSYKRIE